MNFNYPTVLVLLGATGDLARRKLLPALYDLYIRGELPEHWQVIGAATREYDDESFRDYVRELLGADRPRVEEFVSRLRYVTGDFSDDAFYHQLRTIIFAFNEHIGQCSNVLYYMAVPPSLYSMMFTQLARTKSLAICDENEAWARLLVEKPFGNSLEMAHSLEEQLSSLFADEQIYRIDHYLGKGAIENVLALRFGNSMLMNLWNEDCIESIDVTLYEDLDVADRGKFYDGVGALRDVGQNHLLQIIALLLMEPVDIRDANAFRAARARVIDNLRFDSTGEVSVRGQYAGYRDVSGVEPESETETFFRFGLRSVDPTWLRVPVRVAAGKALAENAQEARIRFRPAVLEQVGMQCVGDTHTNELRIVFQPEPRLFMKLATRSGGYDLTVRAREYELVTTQEIEETPEAYERVLLDCIHGEQMRFVSRDEVAAAWRLMDTTARELVARPLVEYPVGTSGAAVGKEG